MENALQSYALALLKLMGNQEGAGGDNPPLGWALHLETRSSVYKLAAHKLLQTLIEHSPSPEAVTQQFMTELAQCENSVVIDLVDSLNSDRSVSPANWAAAVYEGLSQSKNISPLTNLAVFYLNNLVIPLRNPHEKNPLDGPPPTPDLDRADQIESSLDSVIICRDQSALKALVLRRDGPKCPITGMSFDGDGSVIPYCTHIIPLSFHNKPHVLAAIGMFTGNQVTADIIQRFMNNPANAINLESMAHDSMDKRLAWGIEARLVHNEWKYYFRIVKLAGVPMIVRHLIHDGKEIEFGKGDHGTGIAMPDPRLCNLHLAVVRVFAASGFAEVVEKIYRDAEGDVPTGFGEERLRRLLRVSLVSGQRY